MPNILRQLILHQASIKWETFFIYIDIIVIEKNVKDNLKNVETVFARLREANLKVNLDKIHFMKTEAEFLGYIIGSAGIKPDPT